jgi:hypothetical protein
MKRAWRVRRSVEERSDALSRWDRAHQLLLEWFAARATDEPALPAPRLPQEGCDENCHLRQGLDRDSFAAAHHRGADQPPAHLPECARRGRG